MKQLSAVKHKTEKNQRAGDATSWVEVVFSI
jgi:hypothetical protein